MAGEEILGHGKIIVEVEQNVRRELAEAEAQFDRTMAKLDRKEAELKLAIDAKQFDAEKKKIDAQLAEWEKKRATATATLDTRKAVENIDKLQKRQKALALQEQRLANQSKQLSADKAAAEEKYMKAVERGDEKLTAARKKQAQITAKAIRDADESAVKSAEESSKKRIAAGKKARDAEVKEETRRVAEAVRANAAADAARVAQARKTAKAISDAETKAQRDAEVASRRRARESERALKDEIKTETARIRTTVRAASDAERMRQIELGQVKKLQAEYFKMSKTRAKLADKQARVFLSENERIEIDVDMAALDERLARVRQRLEAVGQPPPTIEFDVDERGTKALARWSQALTDTTVRLGPFTSTIGGAIRALTLLGPIITGVVGAAGALAGAIGVGVAGGIGLGAAAVTGFIPLLLGTVLAVKPIITNFQDATKAQKKYNDAVAKHGASSKQAKAAQKELNSVMEHMPESSRKAVKGFTDLKDAWQDAVKGSARKNFGKVLTEGIAGATKLMPMFAARTRGFMDRLSGGITGIFKGLSSSDGKSTLNTIFKNANSSLTPFLHGLGAVGAAFGHITAEFSKYLPGIAKGFDKWAQGLNKASKGSGAARAVHTMVDGFKGLVHLLGSATRLIGTFFGVAAGRGGGIGFMNEIADGFDRISASISDNPQGLGNFFKDSIATAKDLFGVIQPLAALFIEWATIMRPFSNVILEVAGGLGDIVSALAGFGPTKGLLMAAFSVFLAGTLVSKIMSVGGAIKEVIGALKTLGGVKVAGAVLDFATGGAAGNIAGMRGRNKAPKVGASLATGVIDYAAVGAGVKGAEKAAGTAAIRMGALEAATAGAGGALAGLGTAGTIAATGGVALVAGAAAYGGYKLLTMKSSSEKLRDSLKQIDAESKRLNDTINASAGVTAAAGASQRSYTQSMGRVAALKKQLNDLEAHGGKNTAAYKDKLDQLNQALGERQTNENAAFKYGKAADVAAVKLTASILKTSDAHGKLNAALAEQKKRQAEVDRTGTPESKQLLRDATNDVAKAQATYNRELAVQERAQRQAAVNAINYQRTLAGLIPIAGQAGTAIAKLYKRAPKLTQTISLKYADPKDAGAVASKANSALKAGVKSSVVTNIVANSKSAEEAIRRISGQLRGLQAQRAAVKIGVSDQASAKIGRIVAKVNSMPNGEAKIKARDQATATISKIIKSVLHVPDKTARLMARDLVSGKASHVAKIVLGLPNGTVTITAQDQATGKLNAIRALASRAINQIVRIVTVGDKKHADGIGTGSKRHTALVGEGNGPEYVANHKTGRVLKVDSPTFMPIGPENSVIPTESRYAARGRRFAAQFARDMGIPMFAAGKKGASKPPNRDPYHGDPGYYPTQFTPRAPGAYTEGARKRNIKGAGFGKGLRLLSNSPAAAYVKSLQIKQSDLGNEIALKERSIKEPDTFLMPHPTLKNANGDPVMVVNEGAVTNYKSSLADLKSWQDNLAAAIAEEIKYLPTALNELSNIRRDSSKNIKELNKEQSRLEKALENEQKKKKPNKTRVKSLKTRISAIKKETQRETKIHDDSVTDLGAFKDRQRQAGFDYRNAQQDASDTQTDINSVSGKAADQADSGSGGGSGGGGGGGSSDPSAAGSTDIAHGGYDIAAGKASGNVQQQITGYNEQIKGYNDQIATAQGMLSDGDPNNDAQAYDMMASATTAISEATGEIAKLNDPNGGLTNGEVMIARTDALVSEAQAGIVDALTGTVPNLTEALGLSLKAHEARLAEYQGMLHDADTTNDASAWQGISTESQAIGGIKDQMGTSAAQVYNNQSSLSGSRQSLFTSYANNFQLAGTLGGSTSPLASRGAMGTNAGWGGGSGSGTTNVTVNNTFPTPPPEPHAFSTGLKFELQATM